MSSYFWIGGVKVAVTWMWIDGSEMAMGSPFWGRVSKCKQTHTLFIV